jgi:vitamin B12 transporter
MGGVAAVSSPDGAEEIVVIAHSADPGAGSSQVTLIDPQQLPAAADLAAAMDRVPGVVVQRLGALGDLAQVGVRGAGARHAEVLLDGISLNPEGGSAVDLSELPLGAFERVEVYRGAAPAMLGTGGLGGAVSLVPGATDVQRIQLAIGAFGTVRAAGTVNAPVGGARLLAHVDLLHTEGDFPFYDDRGTVPSEDDRITRRTNNDTGQGSALAHFRARSGPVSWSGTYSGLWREEGVPGVTFWPTDEVRYAVVRNLAGLRASAAVGATELAWRALAVQRDEQLSDPNGEIGVGAQEQRDRTRSLGVEGRAKTAWSERLGTSGSASIRGDDYAGQDLLTDEAVEIHSRWVSRIAVGASYDAPAFSVYPSAIGLWLADDRGGADTFVLPRLGAALRADGLEVRSNVGAFARPPDLLELYGDRGPLVGNDELDPERGLQADLGLRLHRPQDSVEVVGFVADYRDQIVWTAGSQGVARPENLTRSTVVGVELAGDLTRGRWSTAAHATLQSANNRDPAYLGNQLPRVPWFDAFALGRLDAGWVTAAIDGTATSPTWADSANVVRQPARLLVGGTIEVRAEALLAGVPLSLELDVRNVANRRAGRVPDNELSADPLLVPTAMVDFTGYPLPGRTWTCTVRWQPR